MNSIGSIPIVTVRHIVMWRLIGRDARERADACARVKSAFEDLRGRIPGLLCLEVGTNAAADSDACHAVLVSDFESQAALDAYATHPAHLQVREELAGLRTARFQLDYRIDPSA